MGLFALILVLLLDIIVVYHIYKTDLSKLRKVIGTITVIFLPIIGVTVYYLFIGD